MQPSPLAIRPSGRPRDSDATKGVKASAKASATKAAEAATCRKFRAQLISLLHEHNLEVLDIMAVLLLDYPEEVEDQSVDALRKRYVSKWLRGDSSLNWPQKEESTLWEVVLQTLMKHPKNRVAPRRNIRSAWPLRARLISDKRSLNVPRLWQNCNPILILTLNLSVCQERCLSMC